MGLYNDEMDAIENCRSGPGIEATFYNIAYALFAIANELEQMNDMQMLEIKQNPKLYDQLKGIGLGWRGDFPNGDLDEMFPGPNAK